MGYHGGMPNSLHQIRESAVEKHLLSECNKLRALCVKNQRIRGWVDRTCYWFDGVTDLIELKRPKGGRFEPLQLRTHEKLRQRGHNVFILNTVEQVDAYIMLRRPHGRAVGEKITKEIE